VDITSRTQNPVCSSRTEPRSQTGVTLLFLGADKTGDCLVALGTEIQESHSHAELWKPVNDLPPSFNMERACLETQLQDRAFRGGV